MIFSTRYIGRSDWLELFVEDSTFSHKARHILTWRMFTCAWLNKTAKWQLTFNRRTRVVDEECAIESSAVEKVELRANATAGTTRTRTFVLIRRQPRRARARRRLAVRIGAEIVRVGTRALEIHALARVAHVVAVRQ